MFDTIASISTGKINQPISIIKISGSDAFKIVKKIFKGKVGNNQTITYGKIFDNNDLIDEVLVSWFKSPNTFTGEDIVEINAHGGVVNTQKILKLLLVHGARLAERGEFSRRSFLNGKMDLIKIEAIHDLIFAQNEEQAKLSTKKFDGQTSSLISNLIKKLLFLIATIETNIDYPEYDDIEKLSNQTIIPKLKIIEKNLQEIQDASKSSRHIFTGVQVIIVGKPNVGKSSLLNAILNEEKAIVTDVPGTTRDIIEGQLQIGQILFNFKDTAGIQDTNDKIEQIGINKAISAIGDNDLVIHVIDSTIGETKEDNKIKDKYQGKPYIKVFNKNDLKIASDKLNVSAKNNNILPLIKAFKSIYKKIDLNNHKLITNTRQLSLIGQALINVNDAIKSIDLGFEPDEVIVDIRLAWKNISSIIGEFSDEKLLDDMFKFFCLGK